VGQAGVAAHQKGAARLNAALVFLDESGFMMAPLVRRSWAPRGATPLLYQRGRSHQKVSAIAALCVPPERNRVHCYFRLHPDTNVDTAVVLSFLRQLATQLKGTPFFLIWDRLRAHRARAVRTFLSNASAVGSAFLPAYAPELNPVEYVWSYLKVNPMANAALLDLDSLTATTRHHARSLQRRDTLLRSFIHHSPLFLRLQKDI
jgi:transposase